MRSQLALALGSSTVQPFEAHTESQHTNAVHSSALQSGVDSSIDSGDRTIVFIDTCLADYQSLVNGVAVATEVVLLDSNQPPIEFITQFLRDRAGISSLHFVSHGQPGCLQFGSRTLDLPMLKEYAEQIATWRFALASNAEILLYGCRVAAGQVGKTFVQALSQLTGATIAASIDLTGNARLGGNWNLEYATGAVRSPLFANAEVLSAYGSVLVAFLNESFTGNDVLQKTWLFGTSTPGSANPFLTARTTTAADPGGLPGGTLADPIGQGALRLTGASQSQGSFVIYNQPISAASGLSITFNLFSYGGNGADGISFFLIDGAANPTVGGAPGRGLGYSNDRIDPNNIAPGITGGYLGIGFDEFGNFSTAAAGSPSEDATNRPAAPDSVVLRGSQANSYQYLAGASVPGGLDVPGANSTRAGSRRFFKIDIDPSGLVTVALDQNGDNAFEANETLISTNVTQTNGALPATFKFGFSASTGDSTNIHEINTFAVDTLGGRPYQPLVSLSTASPTIAENGSTTITAQLDVATTTSVSVPLAVVGGTAQIGSDYTLSSPIIQIPAGQTSGSVTLTGNNQPGFQPDRSTVISFDQPTGAARSPQNNAVNVTITDLDVPTYNYEDELVTRSNFDRTTETNRGDDLLWRNSASGDVGIWTQNGLSSIVRQGVARIPLIWKIVGTGDFNGDGNSDILWRNTVTGTVGMWLQNGDGFSSIRRTGIAEVPFAWNVVGTGDFNGDGRDDILWRNSVTGGVGMWLQGADGLSSITRTGIATVADQNWKVAATGDLNGDGECDIVWRNIATGAVGVWLQNGDGLSSIARTGISTVDSRWKLIATGDFDGDGRFDLLWRNFANGQNAIWLMNGLTPTTTSLIPTVSDLNWKIEGRGDFNADGKYDIAWRNTKTGAVDLWLLNGVMSSVRTSIATVSNLNWQIV